MLRLPTFLVALTLLPSASLAVTPAQVPPNGKAQGFISNLDDLYPQPTGDWLTSTLCYCQSPVRAKEDNQYQKAHIFQHEYYNYHSNATFVVDHMCLARARVEGELCSRPNVGGDNNDWLMEEPYACKHFPRTEEESVQQGNSKRSARRQKRKAPHFNTSPTCITDCDPGPFGPDPADQSSHPASDKVCFATDTIFYGMKTMMLKFNRQRRTMDGPGDQGRVKTPFPDVQGYCEDMCQRRFHMPANMKLGDKRADGGSRQYVYTELDDMCDHCK